MDVVPWPEDLPAPPVALIATGVHFGQLRDLEAFMAILVEHPRCQLRLAVEVLLLLPQEAEAQEGAPPCWLLSFGAAVGVVAQATVPEHARSDALVLAGSLRDVLLAACQAAAVPLIAAASFAHALAEQGAGTAAVPWSRAMMVAATSMTYAWVHDHAFWGPLATAEAPHALGEVLRRLMCAWHTNTQMQQLGLEALPQLQATTVRLQQVLAAGGQAGSHLCAATTSWAEVQAEVAYLAELVTDELTWRHIPVPLRLAQGVQQLRDASTLLDMSLNGGMDSLVQLAAAAGADTSGGGGGANFPAYGAADADAAASAAPGGGDAGANYATQAAAPTWHAAPAAELQPLRLPAPPAAASDPSDSDVLPASLAAGQEVAADGCAVTAGAAGASPDDLLRQQAPAANLGACCVTSGTGGGEGSSGISSGSGGVCGGSGGDGGGGGSDSGGSSSVSSGCASASSSGSSASSSGSSGSSAETKCWVCSVPAAASGVKTRARSPSDAWCLVVPRSSPRQPGPIAACEVGGLPAVAATLPLVVLPMRAAAALPACASASAEAVEACRAPRHGAPRCPDTRTAAQHPRSRPLVFAPSDMDEEGSDAGGGEGAERGADAATEGGAAPHAAPPLLLAGAPGAGGGASAAVSSGRSQPPAPAQRAPRAGRFGLAGRVVRGGRGLLAAMVRAVGKRGGAAAASAPRQDDHTT